jgi:hypothetical protein
MNSPPSVLASAPVPVTSAAPLHHEVFSDPSPTYEKSSDQEEPQSKVALPPIDQWTLADIHLWFARQYISPQLRDLYQFRSGTEVLDYAQNLVNDRMTQQQIYSRLFAKKYQGDELPPHEFNRFVIAMGQLLKENSVEHPLDKQAVVLSTNTSQTKSDACVIF